MKSQRGDVVLVNYPFSEGQGSKVRLGPKLCFGPHIPEALLRRVPDRPLESSL